MGGTIVKYNNRLEIRHVDRDRGRTFITVKKTSMIGDGDGNDKRDNLENDFNSSSLFLRS